MKKDQSNTDLLTTRFERIENFLKEQGEPDYRFGQITKAIFEQRIGNFEEITTLSKKLRESLAEKFGPVLTIKPIDRAEAKQSVKILFELEDGEKVEAVKTTFVEEGKEWSSLCISSQIGCSLGCQFCATGKIGLKRNLTADEIIDQILYFYLEGDKINNISFSGMGEPLLNPAVFTALTVLINKTIFGISPRRINISTVGIIPGLEKLAKDFPQVNIAFSLHSPFQKQREQLMPVAKQYPLEQVMEVLDHHLRKNRRKIFLPYLMLKV
ncbi:MAG: radical SAM protein, partial [Patescibacteria group bacterium]